MNFPEGVIIPVNKPLGWTSTDVVRKLKYVLQGLGHKKIKIGHAGTLDPLATGILIICIGKATKMVDALQSEQKQYVTDIMLGATTPSFDMEHPVSETFAYEHITREMVEEALKELCGERLQTPPVYSAKMIEGRRAYEYAREGTAVKMRQALINIYSMEILEFELPRVKIKVECSKGTYIRSIAMELGEKLSNGAYLSSLCRTRSGSFTLDNASTMEELGKVFGFEMKQN